ncbi:MAG: CoB--CoM heterodisulfide reductase iron-sulfur subunit B family protein [Deltaproteobacteria bacterium]|nr:CoB--CoM heterodisulfide reductase iron-sulfur subunit B family protein [Deltaproteobacteria bacterium]
MKYALFIGCQIPARVRQYESAAREVLKNLGIEVVDIKQFNCCGYPMRDSDPESFMLSSARNIALAGQSGHPMLVLCKCCYGSLKRAEYMMKEDGDLREKILGLLSRQGIEYGNGAEINHFLSVLHKKVGVNKIKESIKKPFKNLNIATHYGCHILRPSKVTQFDDPVKPVIFDELVEITGAKSISWPLKLECCGSHATGVNDGLSMILAGKKLDDARRSGANFITVACPYCHIQFDTVQKMIILDKEDKETIGSILYPQLLGLSMGLDYKKLGIDMNRIAISDISSYVSEG